MCQCGHLKAVHNEDGHGGCARCDCQQFARDRVYKPLAEPGSPRRKGTGLPTDIHQGGNY